MIHSIGELLAAFYAASPFLIWMGVLGSLLILVVTLTTLSLCRASGQADERTERLAAGNRDEPH